MPEKTSYDRVMDIVTEHYRKQTGHDTGVVTWLANGVGIQKQAMTNFKNRGRFPTKYLREISRFTKIPTEAFQPILTDEVLELSRKWRRSVRDTELTLICIGLDNINRR